MATPNRQQILEVIKARLEAIQVANGFVTDTGHAVFLGETVQLGADDPDTAIAIVVGEDEVRYQGVGLLIDLPINVQALAKADLAEPYLAIETILGDIKRALELEDRTLGGFVKRQLLRGSTRTVERQPGSTTVGVSVRYIAKSSEVWGDP